MVALDLDGTLLGPDHRISDASAAYLRSLHERGFTVAIATGRSAPATAEVVRRLDLNFPPSSSDGLPVVCVNGAKGIRVSKKKHATSEENETRLDDHFLTTQLFHYPVPPDLTRKTLALAKEMGCAVNYYVGHDLYAQAADGSQRRATERYAALTGVEYRYCEDDYREAASRGPPSKLLMLCEEEDVDETHARVLEELGDDATIIRGSPPFFVEILRKGVCKGRGLEDMCELLGIGLEECIAFGDGDNDREFLQVAGLGYAMKNARNSVKAVADEVTEWTNAEDSVIRTLQKLEGEGLLELDE